LNKSQYAARVAGARAWASGANYDVDW
jgi:hypothetical protein